MHMQRGMAMQSFLASPGLANPGLVNPALNANPYVFPGLGAYSSLYYNPYGSYSTLPYLAAYMNAYGSAYGGNNGLYDPYVSSPRSYRRQSYEPEMSAREKAQYAEEQRQKREDERLQRSRDNPLLTEIWSGAALNVLLEDLRKVTAQSQSAAAEGTSVPIDQVDLTKINVTRGVGNIGLLKDGGRLDWPVGLQSADYEPERERLTRAALEAVRQAKSNSQVAPNLLADMSADVDRLLAQLRINSAELTPSLYIQAKTCLNSFEDAIKALRQRDVANHFNGKYNLQAKTIGELVKQMNSQGLQFAPANPDNKVAYALIHEALAKYDRWTQGQSAGR
jgi:hypothetical protein